MISVIVPIYNVEEYLRYAMESLVNQTYKDFEVILVDDGSTDNSGELCDQYASEYDWVSAYHKVNGGLSDARNYGVTKAKGDWIVFLDPDDYFEPCALELLMELQKRTGARIVAGKGKDAYDHDSYQNYQINEETLAKATLLSSEETLVEMLYGTVATVSAWAKLFPRDIVEKHPYPKGKIYEDLYVISDYLKEVESVCVIDLGIYHYYRRPNSITLSNFNSKHYDFYDSMDHLKEVIQKDYSANTELDDAVIARLFIGSLHIFILISDSSKKEILRIQRKIRPHLGRVLKNKRINLKNKAIYIMLSLVPGLYYRFKKLKKPKQMKEVRD
ncbi:glycosyltransferase family 2 protein [Streptococcus oralis]|uniref:glycosyltransferase family 2 protein n=1 Tax=Streptococcus oralis TaxID=1303 RepID=UPI0001E53E89|nr:glycosyltransferase family 2 protein [Streptococcus oralis]EFO02411.1 exopolysaccharide biosynthesis protein, sugar transferase [Streptococcus oralis ATCC 35037]